MNPQTSIGVLSQLKWPEVGDIDDCWAMSDMMAVAAVAPWLELPGMTRYRSVAGIPDATGPTGGTIDGSAKAIRALWPDLAAAGLEISDNHSMTFAAFLTKIKANRSASVSVLSGALPSRLRFGFTGTHRIAVVFTDTLRVGNPLAQPHTRWLTISEAELAAATAAYPGGPNLNCLVMPSVASAFRTHPLLAGVLASAVTTGASDLQQRLAEIKQAVAAAAAVVAAA